MLDWIRLLRAQQYYKNLVIFLALFFTKNLFNADLFLITLLGFASLCFISSSYYIINDILDISEDKEHPEKRKRPIASGRIRPIYAALASFFLMALSVVIAYTLSWQFMLFVVALFFSSMLYNLWFKDIAIIDIHFISINFVIRAVSGAVLIGVYTSPWLIVAVFFMALFLAVGKRKSDLSVLSKEAIRHKKVYEVYNEKLLDMMLVVITGVLLFTYSMYTFLVHQVPYPYMMLTIPFASFLIFRYLYFISINHEIARKTHKLFMDRQMLSGFILWISASFIAMYYLIPSP
jgi:4-hydroxybenzoate polyprenyltransferase